MVKKEEILEQSRIHQLSPNIIEKDYVLSWILAGISVSSELNENWVFKGGTCLKKCFFENYRFSEDLDFTLKDSSHVNSQFLNQEFKKISDWIYTKSGIEISKITFEEFLNPRGNNAIEGKIEYRGPMARRGDSPKIKIDPTSDELIYFPTEKREIYHAYSDIQKGEYNATSYCIEEVFAEKIRALVQRMRPRDLFDVINLYSDERWAVDSKMVFDCLEKKCIFKGVSLPTLALLNAMEAKTDLINEWEIMLKHQIFELSPYEAFWDRLPEFFDWLYAN